MKDYNIMFITATICGIIGLYGLYHMVDSDMYAAIGGSFTTNGIIALGGGIKLYLMEIKTSH